METAKWKTNGDQTSTWVQFGPYQLQGITADLVDGRDPVHAAVQLIDDQGNAIAEEVVLGEPDLETLRKHAVGFAARWLNTLDFALEHVQRLQRLSRK